MAIHDHFATMITVPIHQAKTQLTKLLPKVEAGERVVITRHGKPVAELIPARPTPRFSLERVMEIRRELGLSLAPGWIAEDFDDPLTEDDLLPDDPDDPLYRTDP